MKVSQALRIDPKVQRRYVQAQLNEIGEKTVELLQKDHKVEEYIQLSETSMKEFQDALSGVREQLSLVKIDEVGFNQKVAKIYHYFEEAKREQQKLYDFMAERERNLET